MNRKSYKSHVSRRLIVCLAILLASSSFLLSPAIAQSWNMVITMSDGSKQVLPVADIKSMRYLSHSQQQEDKNVDQILIKEVYNGGVMLDDGSKNFQADKCIILYNNCPQQAVVNNLCFAFCSPYNAQSSNKNYGEDGRLSYESQKFLPALEGIWYYPHSLVFEPYAQIVINVHGAIDNTQTVSNSVNYANADYYCMYDPESTYSNTSYYPTPADVIPSSHYLKAFKYGLSNAWALSVTSPALYIFQTKDVTPDIYASNADNQWYDGGNTHQEASHCIKVPVDWVIDGVEIFTTSKPDDCRKRLTADVDAGYVWLTNQHGHAVYRNVDKEWTESLPENAGKLVYNYALGVDASTDPSGIDAEASMKKGAHIVFMDTNNSSVDFHERQKCSLRD